MDTRVRPPVGDTSTDPAGRPVPALSQSFIHSERATARLLARPVQRFLHTETAGGFVLLMAAAVAIVWANSPFADSYHAFFDTHLAIDLGFVAIDHSLSLWINDLLMAFFFFVAGLEIKRELVHGDLRDPRSAALPIAAALGGMVVPALIYTAFNAGGPGSSGWGIPMATDIAFAVGVLALVGNRAPASLKVFLLTLAIVDDMGAIIVIALFYTASLQAAWLGGAAASIVGIVLLRRMRVNAMPPYVLMAALLWLCAYESGIHPTIAGVALGLLTPASPLHLPEAVIGTIADRVRLLRAMPRDGHADEVEQTELETISVLSRDGVSPLQTWQHKLHPWTSFAILPLFALANAGVDLGGGVGQVFTDPVPLGVIAGLVLGKPIGIMAAALITTKLGIARLPRGVGWLELGGVGLVAGVGFTVSIFIAGLAFTDPTAVDEAKVGILVASLIAGVLGYAALVARTTTD